ncbi:NAD(P)H-dependent oxidoreductase [Rubrimonas cliftonensis]|uniref:Putative NADPH-quinone reductase (Modulator of drug activity B) n=1 Tax=Rubrimonas cliftonensis TaxID=89524 RepID=A0A1H4DBH3_9RHOB|nr:NAD(P)H-dependent oxidoreductase [Rubrimonas cliftonensis]SEA69898.1 Putative NADPH-quinone reductase (modulator of drug activity B) [Rubrimonas cliftonensis]
MRVLIVHAHPSPDSYNAGLLRTAREAIAASGHEVETIDLYAEGFDPVLTRERWEAIEDGARNTAGVERHAALLARAEALVFVYPTWWYSMPAMLHGWLERVWVPGVAFALPRPGETIVPKLTHIRRLVVVTTCGASWWLTRLVGAPGKAILTRGCRLLMARGCRTTYLAHYLMDSSTPESRERFRAKVAKALASL